ncbi:MAG: hypothetical protein Q4A90_04260 [Streptococcus sp.]|nr:hypothetical protein [Streptococcus sp.]
MSENILINLESIEGGVFNPKAKMIKARGVVLTSQEAILENQDNSSESTKLKELVDDV